MLDPSAALALIDLYTDGLRPCKVEEDELLRKGYIDFHGQITKAGAAWVRNQQNLDLA